MSRHIRKPTICIDENKGADQLCSNYIADQRLCFRYTNNQATFFFNPWPVSVTLKFNLCRTWLEPILLVFRCTGSFYLGRSSCHNLKSTYMAFGFLCAGCCNFHSELSPQPTSVLVVCIPLSGPGMVGHLT